MGFSMVNGYSSSLCVSWLKFLQGLKCPIFPEHTSMADYSVINNDNKSLYGVYIVISICANDLTTQESSSDSEPQSTINNCNPRIWFMVFLLSL